MGEDYDRTQEGQDRLQDRGSALRAGRPLGKEKMGQKTLKIRCTEVTCKNEKIRFKSEERNKVLDLGL